MRSHQSVTSTPGGALPVCLFGIGIHPSVQPSSRRRHHHRNEVMRQMPSCTQDSIVEPYVILTEATLDQRLDEMTLNEVLLRHDLLQEPPRHALALQMADLDRRREAFKKHRSNRGFVNFLDEQRTFLQRQSHRMQSVIRSMMQNPSFQHEFVTALHSCAKAA